jgi:hypothetical protein
MPPSGRAFSPPNRFTNFSASAGSAKHALGDGHQAIQSNAAGRSKWDPDANMVRLVDIERFAADRSTACARRSNAIGRWSVFFCSDSHIVRQRQHFSKQCRVFSYSKDGEVKTLPARYSFTYINNGERWLIVDHHSSAMPSAPK